MYKESKNTKILKFNPNDVGNINNNIFGLPFNSSESDVIIIPVPWDVTTSYRQGTSKAPKEIFDASFQIDLFDPFYKDIWKSGISMENVSEYWKQKNKKLRKQSAKYMKHLAEGVANSNNSDSQKVLTTINSESLLLNNWVKDQSLFFLDKNKLVIIIGGDHSVPLGLMHALAEKNNEFGILQIDAHADLRNAYEGFQYSHASIMFNALKIPQISKLVQVGIRDYCEDEVNIIESDQRVVTFFDRTINKNIFEGKTWNIICNDIIASLPKQVYISFDIDGLNAIYCPNTGTPVPGGLEFNQVLYLFEKIVESGKNIIGFDICEVNSIKDNEWDCNVAARLLYKTIGMMVKSNQSFNNDKLTSM